MRDSTYGSLCTLLSGLGCILMFTGYDTQNFIVESVINSIHNRDPSRIELHSGFIGLALSSILFMLTNFVAPSLLIYFRPKWLMVFACSLFTLYMASFLMFNRYLYFVCVALLGVANAVFNVGYSAFLTDFSTKKNIEHHSALAWSISNMSVFLGGAIYIIISKKATINSSYREYSDEEIRLLFGSFMFTSLCGVLFYFFFPTRIVSKSVSQYRKCHANGSYPSVVSIVRTLFSKSVGLCASPFVYVGMYFSFMMSVYPTTLHNTQTLSVHTLLPAYYGILYSCGNLTMGCLTSFLSRRITDYGQLPTVLLNTVIHSVIFLLVFLSTPAHSSLERTDDSPFLINPSVHVSMIIGFLVGMGDSCNNLVRTVVCSRTLPNRQPDTFAISRFYQGVGSSMILFLSTFVPVPGLIGLLMISLMMSSFCYWRVILRLRKEDVDGDSDSEETDPMKASPENSSRE